MSLCSSGRISLDEKIEAIQLEIRCRDYRDSIENIRKLVDGLKEILTDASDEGFQDYFTRERKALDGITIDAEFKSFVPRLSEEEYQQLEENILGAGGCHDPLRVWPCERQTRLSGRSPQTRDMPKAWTSRSTGDSS